MRTFKLVELADAAGTSPRTVRYYVQRGLLDAPSFRGKDTEYGEKHLAALRAIFALQQAYLPLDEIASRVRGRSLEELRALADAPAAEAPAASQPSHVAQASNAPSVKAWARVEVAPGLELSLREDADARVVELFERLVRQASMNLGEGK